MSLGQRIARLRQEHNQTLQDVADGADLTPSFLSRLERDHVNISVANLRKLAQFFRVPMTYFFEGEDERPAAELIRASDRLRLSPPHDDVAVFALTLPHSPIEAQLVELPPGASYMSTGEQVLFLIAGRLLCRVGEESYRLEAGDTLLVQRPSLVVQWAPDGTAHVIAHLARHAREMG